MKLWAVIVIKFLTLILPVELKAQYANYQILDEINKYILTNNTDSIFWLYKKPVTPEWEKLLSLDALSKNSRVGINDDGKFSVSSNNPFDPYPIKTVLNHGDITYMLQYAQKLKNKNWHTRFLLNHSVKILKKRIQLPLHQNNKIIKDYYEISIPVFSKNNDISIIQINHLCGIECGSAVLIILKKIDGRWKKVCEKTLWIS